MFADRLMAAANRMIELEPDSPEGYAVRARLRIEIEPLESISPDLERALTLDPKYAYPHVLFSLAYQRTSDFESAIRHINRAIELMPDAASYYEHRGDLQYYAGDKHAAIADYLRATDIQPDYDGAMEAVAVTYSELGQKSEALKWLDKAIALRPDDPQLQQFRREITQ